jgi:hypothetical protein
MKTMAYLLAFALLFATVAVCVAAEDVKIRPSDEGRAPLGGGTSKKTKTRELMSQATSRVTRAIRNNSVGAGAKIPIVPVEFSPPPNVAC